MQVRRATGAQAEHVVAGERDIATGLHVDAVDAHVPRAEVDIARGDDLDTVIGRG